MQEKVADDQTHARLEDTIQPAQRLIGMSLQQLFRITLSGAVIGALVWGVGVLLQNLIIEPLLCRSADTLAMCSNAGGFASNAAAITVGAIGVMVLVRLSVYRPLLIVVASVITLWGAHGWLGDMSWLGSVAWLAFLYALTYALYSWIVRIYNLPITIALIVVTAIAARLVISS